MDRVTWNFNSSKTVKANAGPFEINCVWLFTAIGTHFLSIIRPKIRQSLHFCAQIIPFIPNFK